MNIHEHGTRGVGDVCDVDTAIHTSCQVLGTAQREREREGEDPLIIYSIQ